MEVEPNSQGKKGSGGHVVPQGLGYTSQGRSIHCGTWISHTSSPTNNLSNFFGSMFGQLGEVSEANFAQRKISLGFFWMKVMEIRKTLELEILNSKK